MTTGFVDTSTNMVRVVQNAIESYGMGPIRALAQEPVQNSKDAKHGGTVRVEYRLLTRQIERQPCHLLTVTDCGTTGLQGPILSKEKRDARGGELEKGENWAAFEGQGYTRKDGEDPLGSRGQGKSAFLYHSNPVDSDGNPLDRHIMLYDTRLLNGEYRLGVRYAMPADRVKEPPFLNDDVQKVLSEKYETGGELVVPLGLPLLQQSGTRVIVPYLSNSARDAILNRELHRWLQRCWWRAIQIGAVEIIVIDEETDWTETVQVPSWWANEPWKHDNGQVRVHEDVDIGDGLKIKRIVLMYDEDLPEDEIDGYGPQYSGVQLLRGQQWIETLDVREYVPREFRGGFRGFAEFDQRLERELKKAEQPQHDRFIRRYRFVGSVHNRIEEAVKSFAEERGWYRGAETRAAPEREREIATEFLTVFSSGGRRGRRGSGGATLDNKADLTWKCEIKLDFPSERSARVDWGQSIRNVGITVQCEPACVASRAEVWLELAREDDPTPTSVGQIQDVELIDGVARAEMGDFQIVNGRAGVGKIHAPEPGAYRLRAKVHHSGGQVASATRRLYVEDDPPSSPLPKPHTISVSVQNLSRQGDRRVNSGDEIGVQVTVTNRSPEDATLEINASLEHRLLADGEEVILDGTPLGDVPTRQAPVSQKLRVYTSPAQGSLGPEPHIILPPGRHYLRADLYAPGIEEPVAHSNQPIYVEVNPSRNRDRLPFDLEAVEGEGPMPMWELQERSTDEWVMCYPSTYPIYQQLPRLQRHRSKLSGRLSFIAEICANGLLEWSLAPMANSDSSLIEQLKESLPDRISPDRWESYCERLDGLVASFDGRPHENYGEYMKRWRLVVADMLEMFEDMG